MNALDIHQLRRNLICNQFCFSLCIIHVLFKISYTKAHIDEQVFLEASLPLQVFFAVRQKIHNFSLPSPRSRSEAGHARFWSLQGKFVRVYGRQATCHLLSVLQEILLMVLANKMRLNELNPISTQEKFPWTENFPKISLSKVENLCRPITFYKIFFLRKIFLSGNGPLA